MRSVLIVLLLLAGCSRPEGASTIPAPQPSIAVFAAAGTAPSTRRIARAFEEETGIHVALNFANAGVLARQIEAGADADVFLSANAKWMDHAAKHGRIVPYTRFDLLENRLVVIVPKGKALDVDLTSPRNGGTFSGRLSLGDPDVTPLGIYARVALRKLGWWDALQKQLCITDTAPAALRFVERGEVNGAIMFESIARGSSSVDIVGTIPREYHPPIVFPVALCSNADAAGLRFLNYLRGEKAAAIFAEDHWRVSL